MTSEFTVPPGQTAVISELRWDFEKAFDGKKSMPGVVKTWVASPAAKCQQAHFVCLAGIDFSAETRINTPKEAV